LLDSAPAAPWPSVGRRVFAPAVRLDGTEENVSGSGVPEGTDHVRFAAVFLPHLDDAYRLARWLAGSRADAEDIVQEASLRAFRGIAGFQGADARAWVLSIVRNAAYTWLARHRASALVFTEDLAPGEQEEAEMAATLAADAATPETAVIARSEAERVRAEVTRLPAVFGEVLVLREINELSYQEIASVVGVPIGTVMSRLARARRLLAAAMKERTA
jgi:RNA polymerase sigma-70 factor (ECF subfamily)